MSSAFQQRQQQQHQTNKTWWPHKPKKFNQIVEAIGFKPKKHPTLAIQDPPPLVTFPTRPSSGPLSAASSHADLLEQLVSKDQPHEASSRYSLYTLSDADPFAPSGVVTNVSPGQARLSAYSTTSDASSTIPPVPELPAFYRGSYASSSTSYSHELSSPVMYSPHTSSIFLDSSSPKRVASHISKKSLQRNPSVATNASAPNQNWSPVIKSSQIVFSKSDTSAGQPGGLRPRMADSSHSPSMASTRPSLRPRGMTEGNIQHSGTFASVKTPPSTLASFGANPRVIVRQPSASRIGQPLTAPPTEALPPPPTIQSPRIELSAPKKLARLSSGSSNSSLSFASTVSSNRDPLLLGPINFSPRARNERFASQASPAKPHTLSIPSAQDTPDFASSFSPCILKKALSQQSLGHRHSPLKVSSPPTPERSKKQSPFHSHRIPLPFPHLPLPLRHTNSSGSQSSILPPMDNIYSSKPSHGNPVPVLTTQSRRRLFSGSSLRSPPFSHGVTSEEDAQSTFSLPSEIELPFARHLPSNQHPSFWDEMGPDHRAASPSASTTISDFLPQQIMSPDEIAEVELGADDASIYVRSRALSIMSASTFASAPYASEHDGDLIVFSATDSDAPAAQIVPIHATSLSSPKPRRLRLSLSSTVSRPSISLSVTSSSDGLSPHLSSSPPSLGLPPPPRKKGKVHVSDPPHSEITPKIERNNIFGDADASDFQSIRVQKNDVTPTPMESGNNDDEPDTISELGFTPLSPPPPRRPTATIIRGVKTTALPPPPPAPKRSNRRSLMRKASFLEMEGNEDDDTDKESDFIQPRPRTISARSRTTPLTTTAMPSMMMTMNGAGLYNMSTQTQTLPRSPLPPQAQVSHPYMNPYLTPRTKPPTPKTPPPSWLPHIPSITPCYSYPMTTSNAITSIAPTVITGAVINHGSTGTIRHNGSMNSMRTIRTPQTNGIAISAIPTAPGLIIPAPASILVSAPSAPSPNPSPSLMTKRLSAFGPNPGYSGSGEVPKNRISDEEIREEVNEDDSFFNFARESFESTQPDY